MSIFIGGNFHRWQFSGGGDNFHGAAFFSTKKFNGDDNRKPYLKNNQQKQSFADFFTIGALKIS